MRILQENEDSEKSSVLQVMTQTAVFPARLGSCMFALCQMAACVVEGVLRWIGGRRDKACRSVDGLHSL